MVGPGEGASADSPGLPLGVPSGVSPLTTNISGTNTPGRSSVVSQTPGSSRIAVAYRQMKQWVEDALLSDLNPTVHHVSNHQSCWETTAVPNSIGGGTSTPRTHKRDCKTVSSDFSRSSCSATPVNYTQSPEVRRGSTVIPGLHSESCGHYSNGLPWQVVTSYLSPRWPPAGSHDGTGRHEFNHDPLPLQGRLASVNQELSGTSRPNCIPEDISGKHDMTGRHSRHVSPVQREAKAPGVAIARQSGNATLQTVVESATDDKVGQVCVKNHSIRSWAHGAKGNREAAQRTPRSEACTAASRAPSERNSFLQYGSFRVRWGDIKAEPSPACRPQGSLLCESPTDDEISSTPEFCAAAHQTLQPADRQATALDVPSPGILGTGATSAAQARTQGLQNTESILWRMKDRLSSTFWSKNSGGSRTHISRVSRTDQTQSCAAAVDNHVYGQASLPQKNDPQFHSHLTLVFKDPEVERSYGEFLRKARVKRLIVVGVLTILLNTMYDMPEWIITLTSPVLMPSEASGELGYAQEDNHFSAFAQSFGVVRGSRSLLAFLLVPLDVIEVLLQVMLATSGYLPYLKLHTERTAVIIMLSTSLLSSVRPAAILLLRGSKVSNEKLPREALVTTVQAIMTSTFLRSIVGSVLIDLVCLVRRRKLCHFHKLLSLLLLSFLLTCTVGGMQLSFPYSFFVFSWTVGLATGVVIASCHAGAYMSELMHRKAFHSVSTISTKLQRIQEENKSQRATGKNMLEQLVGLLKQMGGSLSAIDPGNLEKPVRDTLLQVSAIQAKCLGVLTSGRDVYAVNWFTPEVPPEMQVLYKKFIEPYVRQDSIVAGPQDVQIFPVLNPSHARSRSHREINLPIGIPEEPVTQSQAKREKRETPAEAAVFQAIVVPNSDGVCLPEVEVASLTPTIGICDPSGPISSALGSTPVPDIEAKKSKFSLQTNAENINQQLAADVNTYSEATQKVRKFRTCQSNLELRHLAGDQSTHGPLGAEDYSAAKAETTNETKTAHSIHVEKDPEILRRSLWGGFSAESDLAIEESLKSPAVSGSIVSIGTEWTVDMFALDQATNGNCLVLVGLQLLLPHVRNCGLTCTLLALHAFLKSLQDQYLPNLYHNRLHGAMVAHLSVMLARMTGLSRTFQLRLGTPTDVVLAAAGSAHTLVRGSTLSCKNMHSREGRLLLPSSSSVTHGEAQGASRSLLDDEVVVCLAALGHDVGHPGVNNAFLVSTNQSIALVYNDNAVLENYHAYLTFKTISATAVVDGGILKGFSAGAYRQLRKQIIDLILATDMAQHFPTLSSFRARNASQTFSISSNEEDKWMLAKLLIKTGDIGHSMLAWDQHYAWACRVNEEFYKQGDVEERLGTTISPLCDRRKAAEMPAAQCGFLEYIVLPLATELRSCMESQLATPVPIPTAATLETSSTALYLMEGVIAHANYNLRCWKSMTTLSSPQKQESSSLSEPLPANKNREMRSVTEREDAFPSGGDPICEVQPRLE